MKEQAVTFAALAVFVIAVAYFVLWLLHMAEQLAP